MYSEAKGALLSMTPPLIKEAVAAVQEAGGGGGGESCCMISMVLTFLYLLGSNSSFLAMLLNTRL